MRRKLVASTATIRRARQQVNQLYLRQVNIFPPAGLNAADNFFARQRAPSSEIPGRLYVGIAAPGARVRALMIRVYIAAMAAAQQLYDRYGALVDPYMTTVGYFNATRELGGMRRAVDDAVAMRLRQAVRRGLANRRLEISGVEELTSRKNAADIPAILDRLEVRFGSAGDKRPLDVLLATNMISVGVDVSRLGLMVVAGQPKTTAEYIQATSRVGRSPRGPGLVLVAYNWARPRDLSHYERFAHYHATFYQHVEPLSVTPFSPRALSRGLTGVLVSLVRQNDRTFNDNLGAGRLVANHPMLVNVRRRIERRAELVTENQAAAALVDQELGERIDSWLARIQQTAAGARLGYQAANDGQTLGLLQSAGGSGWDEFVCLNSLREVEATAPLLLDNRDLDSARRYAAPAPAAPEISDNEDYAA